MIGSADSQLILPLVQRHGICVSCAFIGDAAALVPSAANYIEESSLLFGKFVQRADDQHGPGSVTGESAHSRVNIVTEHTLNPPPTQYIHRVGGETVSTAYNDSVQL